MNRSLLVTSVAAAALVPLPAFAQDAAPRPADAATPAGDPLLPSAIQRSANVSVTSTDAAIVSKIKAATVRPLNCT